MTRLDRLASQYRYDPGFDKKQVGKNAFMAGFMAARKMCSVMGQIASIEGKDIEKEILAVGTELVANAELLPLPDISGVVMDTLD